MDEWIWINGIPSGKLYKKLLKIVIEIVDFPIKSMMIFNSYVTVYQREISWRYDGKMVIHGDDKWCFNDFNEIKKGDYIEVQCTKQQGC